ncbi:MAG: peroxiredoxin [Candidatus Dormibacteraeota bacterium]|nr:peroxiredoxin [Candidatus Dormibacteraeota bacterium]
MTVEVGDEAPDFTLVDQDGAKVQLSALRGRNVVLIFYPLDFSPTCTRELKEIARTQERYDAAGAEVFGISVDSKHTHKAFRRDEELTARLLSDFQPRGAVAAKYDAYLEDAGFATRATYVIDSKGIVRGKVVNSPANARNADEYLETLASCPL